MAYDDEFVKRMAENLRERQGANTRVVREPVMVRGYDAAKIDRLVASWNAFSLSADGEIRYSLRLIRARSRDLAMNNDYVRKFLNMVAMNVVGPKGIRLQNKSKNVDGSPDKWANDAIEASWSAWGRKGNCTADGKHSWLGLQKLVAVSVPRDGEIFLRKLKGWKGNQSRFALQVIEADYCDEELNRVEPNGNLTKMGIEHDEWGRPVAYWFLVVHPGDYLYPAASPQKHMRIPADEIIHIFLPDRAGQTRGVPWLHTAMRRLQMLGKFEEAAVIAAAVGAAKMGFYTKTADTPTLSPEHTETDSAGNLIQEAEAGSFETLPAGMSFTSFDPKYPDAIFDPFKKAILRGISSGLLVAYESFSNDRENVNYSSIRQGVLDDRDMWKGLQTWLSEDMHTPVYEPWLELSLMAKSITGTGREGKVLPLDANKYDKYNMPTWRPRGWPWIDPLKDENANAAALENKTMSRSMIAAEKGEDLEDIFEELKYEIELAKKYGINLEVVAAKTNTPNAVAPAPADEQAKGGQ